MLLAAVKEVWCRFRHAQWIAQLCVYLALQDELADGARPSGDQEDNALPPDALEQEAAAAVRPDEADCKLYKQAYVRTKIG